MQPLQDEQHGFGDNACPSELNQSFKRRLHFAEQCEVLGPNVNAYLHRSWSRRTNRHLRNGLARLLIVFGEVVPLGPMGKVQIGSAGDKRRGKKLILKARVFDGTRLLERFCLIAGNAELLIRQYGEASALAVEHAEQLGFLVNRAVAESAAPGNPAGEWPSIQRGRNVSGHLVIGGEAYLLGDLEVPVTPVECNCGGRDERGAIA